MGNSVFSYINPIEDFKTQDYKHENDTMLLEVLNFYGFNTAKVSGRNDITIFDRKVSGSAFKIKLGDKEGKNKRSLHHGTMLINVDLDKMTAYLNPNKLKLISKGVESVISRVMNLHEYRL